MYSLRQFKFFFAILTRIPRLEYCLEFGDASHLWQCFMLVYCHLYHSRKDFWKYCCHPPYSSKTPTCLRRHTAIYNCKLLLRGLHVYLPVSHGQCYKHMVSTVCHQLFWTKPLNCLLSLDKI